MQQPHTSATRSSWNDGFGSSPHPHPALQSLICAPKPWQRLLVNASRTLFPAWWCGSCFTSSCVMRVPGQRACERSLVGGWLREKFTCQPAGFPAPPPPPANPSEMTPFYTAGQLWFCFLKTEQSVPSGIGLREGGPGVSSKCSLQGASPAGP